MTGEEDRFTVENILKTGMTYGARQASGIHSSQPIEKGEVNDYLQSENLVYLGRLAEEGVVEAQELSDRVISFITEEGKSEADLAEVIDQIERERRDMPDREAGSRLEKLSVLGHAIDGISLASAIVKAGRSRDKDIAIQHARSLVDEVGAHYPYNTRIRLEQLIKEIEQS